MVSASSNPNPLLQGSLFSRFFHSWLSSLIDKSHQQGTLHLDDLYDLPDHLEPTISIDKLEANWLDEIKRCPQNPSLVRATLRTAGWKYILLSLLLIPLESLNIVQPLLLVSFTRFFEPCSTMSSRQAWSTAFLICMALLCVHLIFHQYVYRVVTCAMQMRVAYSGLIFRKVLRLSTDAMNKFSSGEITNLLANDANKVELLHYYLNYLWIAPLQTLAIIFILWSYVKYITFIIIGYTLFLLFIQPLFSRLFLYLRAEVLKVTDERVKIMSEVIRSMRIIKMYCWESAFERKVCRIRTREMVKTTVFMMCHCIEAILSQSYLSVVFLMIYGTMWSLNLKFDTRSFTLLYVLVNYTRQSCITYFNFAIRDVLNYMAAQKRIRAFLLFDESERDNRLLSTSFQDVLEINKIDDSSSKRPCQVICDLQEAQWEKNGKFSLKNIRFDAYPGDLICIIGSVGSGKSSLLQTLTGEITHFDGKVRLHGSFCYVPQESWIFSSTVKNNIIFGKEYNSKLFQRVVHATALDADLVQLTHGPNTLVGDQGVMLSGGQKARVNMARALYRNADIYLLDDPLSAVDAKVSKHLFEKSIKNYLRDKICILVTHQIQFLHDATKIIVLDNGEMVQMGTYEELLVSSPLFSQLLEDINQHKQEEPVVSLVNQLSMIGSIHSEKENVEDEDMNSSSRNVETKQEGIVKWNAYLSYLRAGVGAILGVLLILIIFSTQQTVAIYSNWWLVAWSNEENRRHQNLTRCISTQDNKTDKIRGLNDTEWNTHRNQRFYVFGALVSILCFLIFIRAVVCRLICLNAARVLHNQMFKRIIRCPISFFDMNPVGRILNRFTSDVAAADDSLPMTVFECLSCLSQVLGAIILVGLLNPWSFIPAGIAIIVMFFIRYRFAACARDLKRLQGTTRSPVYSQLTSTIHGLKVIRSYHAENICSKEFDYHLGNNSRVSFLIIILNRWSAMRFDWISLIFITVVIILSIVARLTQHQFSAVEIALTLTYSLSLVGVFQWTIRQSVEVENQMTSVERILEYCSLDQEPPAQLSSKHQPPANWPPRGCIVFDDVSMSHSNKPNSLLTLYHVSLIIEPSEKIGIVGRTGAGKSSFIQTLFRMGTIVDGRILIDNIDIATLGLDDVRRRISIIPQDPVLFTGTMRSNLDPFGIYSDPEIWNALEQVQLKTLVADIMSNGLHSLVSESGSNLSVGQKQLVCLARAILKKSKILVIDEATANVDNATDELIQKAIRDKFKECTVLTVAHRLRSVIDSDRIMVLSDGKMVEFDAPEVLLSNQYSYFSSLVEQTGVAEAEYLRTLANSNELHKNKKQKTFELDDETMLETNEMDPLVPSAKLLI
ncbi:unnamed protein product [Rotaria socialis]|uniref:Uncharacterized protein n=1 Tax=Rotaria socialis TaxID=392032 RepID=A0A820LBC9_9BILA|nr:unnamed protein product [Rotaria socialis]